MCRHQAIVDCRMKRVTLRTPNEDEVTFIGERSNHLSNVISAATARKMVWKGCEAYLDYVIDTVEARSSVSNIPIISDYLDVFPEELPGLPLSHPQDPQSDPNGGSKPKSGARYYLYYILGLSLTCFFSELYLYL